VTKNISLTPVAKKVAKELSKKADVDLDKKNIHETVKEIVKGISFRKPQRRQKLRKRLPRNYVIPLACFLQLIRENRDKIFVHCRLGDYRVGMMIAAYRMAEQGWTADEAMREKKSDGFSFSHHFICGIGPI
jgi:protein tyrosine/serine phosphatase